MSKECSSIRKHLENSKAKVHHKSNNKDLCPDLLGNVIDEETTYTDSSTFLKVTMKNKQKNSYLKLTFFRVLNLPILIMIIVNILLTLVSGLRILFAMLDLTIDSKNIQN